MMPPTSLHKLKIISYLAEQTKIPVPKIFGYCVDDSTDPLATFLILEFINGEQLSLAKMTDLASEKRKNLFGSLADIYLQLRRLEFPSIGRLEGSASNPRIGKTATISMNMLQLEGLDSFGLRDRFLNEHGKLESATSYTNMLLAIGYDAFLKSPYTAPTGMGLTMSRNHQLFIQHVGKWVDTDRDKGPFVLVHGDLHISNLVIDDDARIISVLDWEWSSVVPVQYFTPPLWLNGRDSVQLASPTSWKLFLKRAFKDFLAIVESREIELYGNCQLHSEWSQAVENAEPLVANALLNWTDVDWLVERSMNCKQVPSDDEQAALVKENPTHGLLAEIKELDYDRYRQALQHLEAKKATEAEQAGVWNLMKRTCDVRQNASTVIILGCSVAACVIIAAVWRRL